MILPDPSCSTSPEADILVFMGSACLHVARRDDDRHRWRPACGVEGDGWIGALSDLPDWLVMNWCNRCKRIPGQPVPFGSQVPVDG